MEIKQGKPKLPKKGNTQLTDREQMREVIDCGVLEISKAEKLKQLMEGTDVRGLLIKERAAKYPYGVQFSRGEGKSMLQMSKMIDYYSYDYAIEKHLATIEQAQEVRMEFVRAYTSMLKEM